jgi:hypothetical protein
MLPDTRRSIRFSSVEKDIIAEILDQLEHEKTLNPILNKTRVIISRILHVESVLLSDHQRELLVKFLELGIMPNADGATKLNNLILKLGG